MDFFTVDVLAWMLVGAAVWVMILSFKNDTLRSHNQSLSDWIALHEMPVTYDASPKYCERKIVSNEQTEAGIVVKKQWQ